MNTTQITPSEADLERVRREQKMHEAAQADELSKLLQKPENKGLIQAAEAVAYFMRAHKIDRLLGLCLYDKEMNLIQWDSKVGLFQDFKIEQQKAVALRRLLGEEQAKADKWRSLFERQRFIDTCSTAERAVEQNTIDLAVVMMTGDTPQPPKRSTL